MIQNVKKGRRFCRSVGRPDRPADRIWPATVFFSFYNSKWSKTWKKTVAGFADRSVRSVRRTEFDRRPFFSPFGSFGVDLEIFFSTKKFWPKKTFQLNIWHHAVNSEIFLSFFWSKILVENFFSKSTPNDPKREKTWKKIAGQISGFAGRTVRRTEFDHFSR